MAIDRVWAPASTANLGPGFDALGMALSLGAEVGLLDVAGREVDEHHPAAVAFTRAGGRGRLWVRSAIPMSRGLGFSGAMRVGGAALAVAQAGGDPRDDDARREIFAVAAELEGHGDNAAASVYGGLVATAAGHVVPVPMAVDPDVVVWVPDEVTTSTNASRTQLPPTVAFADAVANVGATALLVAALAAGRTDVLRPATTDRLHQDHRLAAVPESAAALAAGRAASAWCGWLSGSGPSVAFLTERGSGARLADRLPASGHVKLLTVDRVGVRAAHD